jgi:hypothetical protein
MIRCPFVIGEGAVVDALGVNQKGQKVIVSIPPCVGIELYRSIGDGKYVYTGTVTAIEKAGRTTFGHIDGLNIFIPHGSSPIDSSLEVGMVHSDAWKVSVDFIDPIEQIICICGVNVRLSKTMNP